MAFVFARSPRDPKRPRVRPWAIAGPILILLIAAPLLRPLLAPGQMSDRERAAMESVRSVLQNGTLALDPHLAGSNDAVIRLHGQVFSKDPPSFAILLSGVAWCIEHAGIRFQTNPSLLNYLLIFFAITLPTAIGCGLLYRTSRIFELRRPWRAGLALACVLATGWISYATVLLPNALAAALVVAAVASVVQVAQSKNPGLAIGWLFAGGFCAALAVTIEPLAFWIVPVLIGAIFAIPLLWRWRVAGLFLLALGAAGPVSLYVSVNRAITGDLLPPRWHAQTILPIAATAAPSLGDDAEPLDASVWLSLGRAVNRGLVFTVGPHGAFSHFPVLLLGIVGTGIVLRRHWTRGVKWLAAGSVGGFVVLIIYKSIVRVDDIDADFAAARFTVILPVLMLWAGAWLRRTHGGLVWTMAGIALAVSVFASVIGATDPAPPGGYQHFTVAEAFEKLVRSADRLAAKR